MQYALFIHEAPHAGDGVTDDEQTAITAEYPAIRDDHRVVGAARLGPVDPRDDS